MLVCSSTGSNFHPGGCFEVKLLFQFEIDIQIMMCEWVTLQTHKKKTQPDFTKKEWVLIAQAEGLICYQSAVADVSYFHANVRQFST